MTSDPDPAAIPLTPEVSLAIEKNGQYNDSDATPGLSEGDTLTYTFDVTNTGDVTVTGVVINEDSFDLPGPIVITPPADIDLSPGETQQWTGTWTLTQADIDNTFASTDGDVDNSATASGTAPRWPRGPIPRTRSPSRCPPFPYCPSRAPSRSLARSPLASKLPSEAL